MIPSWSVLNPKEKDEQSNDERRNHLVWSVTDWMFVYRRNLWVLTVLLALAWERWGFFLLIFCGMVGVMKKWQKEIEWLIRDKYDSNRSVDLADDLKRLKVGEPIDYIIGWKEFLGVKIDLSERPLIPRPETEYWVEKAIEDFNKKEEKVPARSRASRRVLDIFAGSGCVGLSILKHCPDTKVDFADLDKRAIKQIKINLELNKKDIPDLSKSLSKRSQIIKSDIFSNIKGRYDLVLANPPYVPAGRKLSFPVVGYEPKRALFSGADGLAIIKKFLKELPGHLKTDGICYLEFDSGQKREIEKFLGRLKYQNYTFHRDQFGRFRFVVVKKCSLPKPRISTR